MAISPKFYLRDSGAIEATSIQLVVNFNNCRFKYGTGIAINPNHWDKNTYRPATDKKTLNKLDSLQKRDLKVVKSKLDDIAKLVTQRYSYLEEQDIEPTPQLFKDFLNEKLNNNQATKKEAQSQYVIDYLIKYIEKLDKGIITTAIGKQFAKGTIKNYRSCLTQLQQYQTAKRVKLRFKDVNLDLHTKLVEYFNSKDYSPNTSGKHIKILKVIMNASYAEGLHNSEEFKRKKFKVLKVDTNEIYLTEKEIKALYEIDISRHKEYDQVRDIFLVGVYTAQRFSDYSRINSENIKHTSKGNKIIKLIQKKTGAEVQIPVRPELEAILQKYNNNLPKIYEQKVNKLIKEIGQMAGIDTIEQIEKIRGGKKVVLSLPKYKLISTHTARRSGLTNMYLNGINTIALQKISGHKSESNLLKYIRVTREENADILATHHYFTQPLKVAK